jgi:hypothetical protein
VNTLLFHTFTQHVGAWNRYFVSVNNAKSVDYQIFEWFLTFRELLSQFVPDMSGLWTEHIQLIGHVRPLAQTCPVLGSLRYIRIPLPLRTLVSIVSFSTQSPADARWPKVILGLLHWIPLVSRGFASPNPHDLQTLVGFLSLKVFSRIIHDLFVLRRSLKMHGSMCLVVSLECLSPNLSLA